MSKIEWHKVTWYSKSLALAIFVIFPFIGFYFGLEVGKALNISSSPLAAQSPLQSQQAGVEEYYSNISEWQAGSFPQYGFSMKYPIDFQTDEWTAGSAANSGIDWRLNANGASGNAAFTITIPKAFEPHTNFADARLSVGRSNSAQGVSECMIPDPGGENGSTSTVMINGINFFGSKSTGVGAGNYYETTSYRAVHGGYCYAVEYTIHSTQIMNYPAEYRLTPFDEKKAADLLDRVAGTFTFL